MARTAAKTRNRRELFVIAFITLLMILIGTTFYHITEELSIVDALYLSVITLTTVGYGDITPHTTVGKLFTIGYVIIGIGIIATFARAMIQGALSGSFRRNK